MRLLLAVLAFLLAVPAAADYGSGCPMTAFAGMKAFEDENGNQIPHQGQWFTANYTGAACGFDESDVTWTSSPEPPVSDTCFGAWDYIQTQAHGERRCGRTRGKVFWVPPGVWTLTACAPPVVDGVCKGTWTIESYVVD